MHDLVDHLDERIATAFRRHSGVRGSPRDGENRQLYARRGQSNLIDLTRTLAREHDVVLASELADQIA